MKAIWFEGATHTLAENQPQYTSLPARIETDGVVTTCYQLTWRELWHLIWYRRIWFQQMAFLKPMQPQKPSVVQPVWTEAVAVGATFKQTETGTGES